jgi:hypothetical protein
MSLLVISFQYTLKKVRDQQGGEHPRQQVSRSALYPHRYIIFSAVPSADGSTLTKTNPSHRHSTILRMSGMHSIPRLQLLKLKSHPEINDPPSSAGSRVGAYLPSSPMALSNLLNPSWRLQRSPNFR